MGGKGSGVGQKKWTHVGVFVSIQKNTSLSVLLLHVLHISQHLKRGEVRKGGPGRGDADGAEEVGGGHAADTIVLPHEQAHQRPWKPDRRFKKN